MRKGILFFALTVLSIVFLTGNAFALVNAGFETGNLTGWSNSGSTTPSVVSSFGSYLPAEGNYFALLGAGSAGVYTALSQGFTLNAGESIFGAAAFDAGDYYPFNDDAYVKILLQTGALIATPWSKNIATVGDYNNTPWQNWSWTADQSGTYLVQYGVANQGDGSLASYGLFDMTQNQNVIPEPTTMSLLGIGLLGLLKLKRKK